MTVTIKQWWEILHHRLIVVVIVIANIFLYIIFAICPLLLIVHRHDTWAANDD